MNPFNPRDASRRLLAKMLARVELHCVQTLDTADGEVIWKSRRRASRIVVSAGNLYLRMQRAGVEILTTDEWLRWELAVWTAKHETSLDKEVSQRAAKPCVRSNGLMIPRSPGEPLSHILADSRRPIGGKLPCVGWALRSLERLQARSADWGGGLMQPISHGDATAENVIIDISRQCACWIDFDTRHRANLRAIERHADDLRALIFSAAIHLTQPQYQQLTAQIRASYTRREVIAEFRSRLTSDWRRPNTFQLAQAPLPFHAARALSDALVADL